MVRIQLDGLAEGGDGRVQLALALKCGAKVVLGRGVSRPGRQRCTAERNRLVKPWRVYFVSEEDGQVKVDPEVAGVLSLPYAQHFQATIRFATDKQARSEHAQCRRRQAKNLL